MRPQLLLELAQNILYICMHYILVYLIRFSYACYGNVRSLCMSRGQPINDIFPNDEFPLPCYCLFPPSPPSGSSIFNERMQSSLLLLMIHGSQFCL